MLVDLVHPEGMPIWQFLLLAVEIIAEHQLERRALLLVGKEQRDESELLLLGGEGKVLLGDHVLQVHFYFIFLATDLHLEQRATQVVFFELVVAHVGHFIGSLLHINGQDLILSAVG